MVVPDYIVVFIWLTEALSLDITMEGSTGRKTCFSYLLILSPTGFGDHFFFYFPAKMWLLRFTSKASWGRFWDSPLFISCACQHFE